MARTPESPARPPASWVHIRSDDLMARNQGSPDYGERIASVTEKLGAMRQDVVLVVPAYSVGALVLSPNTGATQPAARGPVPSG